MSAQNRLAGGSQRDRRTVRNAIVFTIWIFLFSVSFLAGHWLLDAAGWKPEGAVGVAYSLLPVIPGLIAFRAYLKLFREADELMRKVLVEGVLYGFGAVMLFWGAIQLPEHVWLSKVKADTVITVMMIAWSLGTIFASWRYR
jgi:MFS family permease